MSFRGIVQRLRPVLAECAVSVDAEAKTEK
jgi:hypothetical protein